MSVKVKRNNLEIGKWRNYAHENSFEFCIAFESLIEKRVEDGHKKNSKNQVCILLNFSNKVNGNLSECVELQDLHDLYCEKSQVGKLKQCKIAIEQKEQYEEWGEAQNKNHYKVRHVIC